LDFEALRAGLAGAIPFNGHLGLELVEVGPGRGVVRLPDRPELHNHVGTQHAGGLFAAGEFASGGAFIGAFADHLANVTPLARSAEIEYRKLARGEITATGRLDDDVAGLLQKLEKDGKVEFEIDVKLADASGAVVATMTVAWHVRRNAPAQSR
jgi:acyl-coenzyme A thioesterase PaaI-like protein